MKGLKTMLVAGGSIALGILLANGNFYGRTYAQQSAPAMLKIGVVNLQICFDKCDAAKDYKESMNNSFQKSKDEISDIQKRIKDLKEQIQGAPQGTTLWETKYKEYLELNNSLEFRAKWNEAQLESLHESYMAKVYSDARNAVEKIAQEQGLTAVFKIEGPLDTIESKMGVAQNISYRAVLYASKAMDITDAVLSAMNAEYKKKK